jgi:hypothetical protein
LLTCIKSQIRHTITKYELIYKSKKKRFHEVEEKLEKIRARSPMKTTGPRRDGQ